MVESIGITVDCCAEALDQLADFWAAALAYEKVVPLLLGDPTGKRPRLACQSVPEPKVAKNRWHLDLYVQHLDELEPEVHRLSASGRQRFATSMRSSSGSRTPSLRCQIRKETSFACAHPTYPRTPPPFPLRSVRQPEVLRSSAFGIARPG